MLRFVYLVYGVFCYLLFLVIAAWLMAFVADFAWLPRTIDRGATLPTAAALAVDVLLVGMFGLQHSVMARPAFKRWWTQWVPQPIERSTYLLASFVMLLALVLLWQPVPMVVWNVGSPWLRQGLWFVFFAGGLMVPLVSLLINHFDLFGLRQTWLHWRGRAYEPLAFRTPGLYAFVRHPLYVGWAIAFWAIPTMTVGHLAFATAMCVYMAIAVRWEESDLVAHFGAPYANYRQRVGMFLPKWNPAGKTAEAPQSAV